jgi:hypothetical protein
MKNNQKEVIISLVGVCAFLAIWLASLTIQDKEDTKEDRNGLSISLIILISLVCILSLY